MRREVLRAGCLIATLTLTTPGASWAQEPPACADIGGVCMEGCEPGYAPIEATGCFDSICCSEVAGAPSPDESGDIVGAMLDDQRPRLSTDGRWLMLAYSREDGARGEENMYIEVQRIGEQNHVVLWAEVLSPDVNTDTLDDAAARIAAVAAFADTYDWVAMEPMTYHLGDTSYEGEGGGVARLTAEGGSPLVLLTAGHWVVASAGESHHSAQLIGPWRDVLPAGSDEPECVGVNSSYVSGGWVNGARSLVLLKVSYFGTDVCWEPDSEYHALWVALPTSAATDAPTCQQLGGECMEGCEAGWRLAASQGTCFDSGCCLPNNRPVRCEALRGGTCAEDCSDGVEEQWRAYCTEGICCAPGE